jgi:uncharacterized protein YciI
MIAAGTFALAGCTALPSEAPTPIASVYNEQLATEFGADEYGMRSFVLVTLKTGPADITDKEKRSDLFSGHFANISRLAEQGNLVLAGPLGGEGGKRGIFVLNTPDIETAKAMMVGDPTITSGIFTPEYNKFYGSAALMGLNDVHAQIRKTKVGE